MGGPIRKSIRNTVLSGDTFVQSKNKPKATSLNCDVTGQNSAPKKVDYKINPFELQ